MSPPKKIVFHFKKFHAPSITPYGRIQIGHYKFSFVWVILIPTIGLVLGLLIHDIFNLKHVFVWLINNLVTTLKYFNCSFAKYS